jgi:hypothetical protein
MRRRFLPPSCAAACIALVSMHASAGDLAVVTDFEGASARVVAIDQRERSIRFEPGGDPRRVGLAGGTSASAAWCPARRSRFVSARRCADPANHLLLDQRQTAAALLVRARPRRVVDRRRKLADDGSRLARRGVDGLPVETHRRSTPRGLGTALHSVACRSVCPRLRRKIPGDGHGGLARPIPGGPLCPSPAHCGRFAARGATRRHLGSRAAACLGERFQLGRAGLHRMAVGERRGSGLVAPEL